MYEVFGLLAFGLLGATGVLIWLNSDWIAPGGWVSWLKCRLRK
jgi:hypothetical protein